MHISPKMSNIYPVITLAAERYSAVSVMNAHPNVVIQRLLSAL